MLTDVRLTPMPILERIHRTSPKRTSCVQSDFLGELLVSACQMPGPENRPVSVLKRTRDRRVIGLAGH